MNMKMRVLMRITVVCVFVFVVVRCEDVEDDQQPLEKGKVGGTHLPGM